MLGEIIQLKFPAPDEESEIKLIEEDEDEVFDDPNSQDNSKISE